MCTERKPGRSRGVAVWSAHSVRATIRFILTAESYEDLLVILPYSTWFLNVDVLADVTQHLSSLCLKLKARIQIFLELSNAVKALQRTLSLFQMRFSAGNMKQNLIPDAKQIWEDLFENFVKRFQDVNRQKRCFHSF